MHAYPSSWTDVVTGFRRGVTLRGAGAGLLGAGLGTLSVASPRSSHDPARRELAWKIEVGSAEGCCSPGPCCSVRSARLQSSQHGRQLRTALLWEARSTGNGAIGSAGWYALGGGLVGAGIGLGASAALGLLVRRLVPARSAAAWPVRPQGLAIAF
jgi:hypothetical protein